MADESENSAERQPRADTLSASRGDAPAAQERSNGIVKAVLRKRSAPFPGHSRPPKRPHQQQQPPCQFLMGGNINDPLNLSGLADECPKAGGSPREASSDRDDRVDIVIPRNPKDPLNLLLDESDASVVHRRSRKRRRHNSLKLLDSASSTLVGSCADEAAQLNTMSDSELANIPSSSLNVDGSGSGAAPAASKSISPSSHEDIANPVEGTSKGLMDLPPTVSKTQQTQETKKKKKDRFRYGNYARYYDKRIGKSISTDPRLELMQLEWFQGRTVLDIGCNMGYLTVSIAQEFSPKRIVGIDIDPYLIHMARRNLRMHLHYAELERLNLKFPPSFVEEYGPIVAPPIPIRCDDEAPFPYNVVFKTANYVLESDGLLETVQPEYDTILAFSLTKWVQLNWGDEGLKRFFKRVYRNLRPGGIFLLEPQPHSSYKKRKGICPEMAENYARIELLPHKYNEYLLSEQVGFTSCVDVGVPGHFAKGFQRPIQLYRKPVE